MATPGFAEFLDEAFADDTPATATAELMPDFVEFLDTAFAEPGSPRATAKEQIAAGRKPLTAAPVPTSEALKRAHIQFTGAAAMPAIHTAKTMTDVMEWAAAPEVPSTQSIISQALKGIGALNPALKESEYYQREQQAAEKEELLSETDRMLERIRDEQGGRSPATMTGRERGRQAAETFERAVGEPLDEAAAYLPDAMMKSKFQNEAANVFLRGTGGLATALPIFHGAGWIARAMGLLASVAGPASFAAGEAVMAPEGERGAAFEHGLLTGGALGPVSQIANPYLRRTLGAAIFGGPTALDPHADPAQKLMDTLLGAALTGRAGKPRETIRAKEETITPARETIPEAALPPKPPPAVREAVPLTAPEARPITEAVQPAEVPASAERVFSERVEIQPEEAVRLQGKIARLEESVRQSNAGVGGGANCHRNNCPRRRRSQSLRRQLPIRRRARKNFWPGSRASQSRR